MNLKTLPRITLPFLAVLLCSGPLRAADWPRFLGPNASGVSPENGLARAWPTNGPRVLWSADVGEGFASPAVVDAQVFLLDRRQNKEDLLRCFDLETGRELWTLAYDAPGSLSYNGSRNVPTVDVNRIFTLGPFGHLHCIDRTTHQILWAKHLVNDFKDPQIDRDTAPKDREDKLLRAQVPMWGMTQAPLVYKDTVIVAPQTQTTGLVAYDKASGEIRWRSPYIGRNWYAHVSPALMNLCGVEQVIMLAQPSDPEEAPPAIISSIDPDTGRILWTTKTPGRAKIPIPQPLRVGHDRLFITGGYYLGGVMLQVTNTSAGWETKILSHKTVAAGHIHSPVFYRDHIYLTSFTQHGGKNSGLVCLNREGDAVWQTGPALQFDSGGFLIADGMAWVMHGKNGILHLFELGESGAKLLAKASVLEAKNGNVWAPLALSNGRLLVRDQHQMKCLDVRQKMAGIAAGQTPLR